MTYEKHYRISMIGTIGANEIFSMRICMADNPLGTSGFPLEPNAAQWGDIRDDCVAWFARPATGIHQRAVLKTVKIAYIKEDGLYDRAPVEFGVNQPGGAGNGLVHANQVARVVTLHTAGDLGRVKGRFYVPCPVLEVGDGEGRWTAAQADAAEASDRTLINDLNNEPGLDVLGLRVVVASQGRTRNGVPVLGPDNHRVTAVSVGRTPDTQRRRRSAVPESRTVLAL